MTERTQRKLAAIVSADVVGYSRLMGADETGTLAVMRAHRKELWNPTIEKFGGRIVGTAGDSILVEFASAVAAVESSISVQKGMAARNAGFPEDKCMLLRIGINIGDVIVADDDIYGDGVNVAARLQEIAAPGGLAVSGNVHEQIQGKVIGSFSDDGQQEMKNIVRPISVWRWSPQTGEEAHQESKGSSLALPDKPSIAVLPFNNMSGDPEQEYFSDGMTEDIITALSRLRWLFVIARNSTFTYKGRAVDVKQVGREMGVRYVLEGSVRKAGQRVRVTAQLIEAESGNHIWADRYDRDLTDIFDLQDELTEAISAQVNAELASSEREHAHRKSPTNLDAWDLYQRGMWHYYKFLKEDNAEARRLLLCATELAPEFANAHAGLAAVEQSAAMLGYAEDETAALKQGLAHAEEAIKLDDREGFNYFALGRISTLLGDRDRALSAHQKSISLTPSSAACLFGYGYSLWYSGRAEEGLPLFARAIRFSPHDPQLWMFHYLQSICNFAIGQYDEAANEAKLSIQVKSDEFWSHLALALAYSKLEKADTARAAVDQASKLLPKLTIAYLQSLMIELHPPYLEEWSDTLRIAGLKKQ